MTTTPVTSITDEQLAEIESLASSINHWNMPKAFQEAEEGVHPSEWEWHVGAIDEDGNQYPLLHVNAHQYDSDDSELLARYYAACNQSAIIGLIARLRAAEADAKRFRLFIETVEAESAGATLTAQQKHLFHCMNSVDSVTTDQLIGFFDAAMERKA